MRCKKRFSLLFVGMILVLGGCENYLDSLVYQRPPELEGKLYTQLKNMEQASRFLECLEITGMAEQIERTGYYTVFAPTNEAFDKFFQEHPAYAGDIKNIPVDKLERIVRFHILQSGWTKNQLRSLDFRGWINPRDDFYNEPRGYKRQTLLKDPDTKYWVQLQRGNYTIVDQGESNLYRIVYTDSRKYAPLYYQELFDIYNYTSDDYAFYYNRSFDGGKEIHFANSRLKSEEIPAENGFIYLVDQVVPPMENLEVILKREDGHDYSLFLNMIYKHALLTADMGETMKQPGVSLGLDVDTLYRITYPDLVVNISNEIAGRSVDYNVREHNTIIAPTNEAINRLFNEIVTVNSGYPHWPSKELVPDFINAIIVNAHMSARAEYKSNLLNGFLNGVFDTIRIDNESILEKQYGSNGVFVGVKDPVVPRVFTSVAAPVYLRPGFSTFMYAVQASNVLAAIKSIDKEYEFFVISEETFSADSSMIMEWDDATLTRYSFFRYAKGTNRRTRISQIDLMRLILNQVVIGRPPRVSNVEFLPTLGGNYVRYDHVNNTVRGARPTLHGFEGDSIIVIQPQTIDYPVDNGATYVSQGWFSVPNTEMFSLLSRYSKFMELLDKTGLANRQGFSMNLTRRGDFYTVFAPSDAALNAIGADTIHVDRLREILKTHFIDGQVIFTDRSAPDGLYETMRADRERLNIVNQPDKIIILDDERNVFLEINEDPLKTNIIVGHDTNTSALSLSELDFVSAGVIHEVDKVLNFK